MTTETNSKSFDFVGQQNVGRKTCLNDRLMGQLLSVKGQTHLANNNNLKLKNYREMKEKRSSSASYQLSKVRLGDIANAIIYSKRPV